MDFKRFMSFQVIIVFCTALTTRLVSRNLYTECKYNLNCSDFKEYRDAAKSYYDGNDSLDKDSDGIPCEALFAKSKNEKSISQSKVVSK